MRYKVAILGATGAVGQRFIQLLQNHPLFEITQVCASSDSVGKPYGSAANWRLTLPCPEQIGQMVVHPCEPGEGVDLVFSALPSQRAKLIEPRFAAAGLPVVSNASAYRMTDDIPLLIPEVNPDHTGLIHRQRIQRGWSGFIVTNPNCATVGMAIPLKPLNDAFGIERVHVVTMQARSGAGYPGPPAEEIEDNVLPFIEGEEDKLETEPNKILGRFTDGSIQPAGMKISAQCHRVDVWDGHFEALSIGFRTKPEQAELVQALRSFTALPQKAQFPSAPTPPIRIMLEPDRPQPKRDRDNGGGMTVSVGRISSCPVLDYRMVVLSHNTIRGAAGAAILNGELLAHQGFLE